jgi:hypothetical protein
MHATLGLATRRIRRVSQVSRKLLIYCRQRGKQAVSENELPGETSYSPHMFPTALKSRKIRRLFQFCSSRPEKNRCFVE